MHRAQQHTANITHITCPGNLRACWLACWRHLEVGTLVGLQVYHVTSVDGCVMPDMSSQLDTVCATIARIGEGTPAMYLGSLNTSPSLVCGCDGDVLETVM